MTAYIYSYISFFFICIYIFFFYSGCLRQMQKTRKQEERPCVTKKSIIMRTQIWDGGGGRLCVWCVCVCVCVCVYVCACVSVCSCVCLYSSM